MAVHQGLSGGGWTAVQLHMRMAASHDDMQKQHSANDFDDPDIAHGHCTSSAQLNPPRYDLAAALPCVKP